ncbi:hypothetical protein SteCoe_4684 [Stentor coeruleus]|uniref:Uncharacterized protein n=1 Tax=Stentor coeruleus TaxID=5963 RepID=A0A1R2CU48_9CILI|nr:hypothetical protein SteCoe_4684 [Stentor coeruleus]
MSTDLITSSLQLDNLIQEKLKSFWVNRDTSACPTILELKTHINSLKYIIYILNQDRINLRQELIKKASIAMSLSIQPENQSKKPTSSLLIPSNSDQILEQYELYDINSSSSDMCTVVNTSVLHHSVEPTEREFSPFAISPMLTPRPIITESVIPMTFLTTEATHNRNKFSLDVKSDALKSDDFIVSSSNGSEIDLSFSILNCSSYIQRHPGDEVVSPPCMFSSPQSRQDTRSPM